MRAVSALATPRPAATPRRDLSRVRNSAAGTTACHRGSFHGAESGPFQSPHARWTIIVKAGEIRTLCCGMAAIAGMRMSGADRGSPGIGCGGERRMAKIPMTFACGLYDRMPGALYRRGAGRRHRSRLSRHRRSAAESSTAWEESRFRRLRNVELRGHQPTCRRPAGDGCTCRSFPSRVFRHGFITVNRKAVRTPKELAGKRIGVPLYTQTAALFIRGLLQDEYDVDLSGVHWVQGATNSAESHGNPSAPPLLKPVSIEQNTSGRSPQRTARDRRDTRPSSAAACPWRCAPIPTCNGLYFRISTRSSSTITGATRIFPDHASRRHPPRPL